MGKANIFDALSAAYTKAVVAEWDAMVIKNRMEKHRNIPN
jgi:hypothetical protein